MSIKVEFLVGTSFHVACTEARNKAIEWDVAYIKFDFNGVRVSVGQKATIDDEAFEMFRERLNGEHKFLVLN